MSDSLNLETEKSIDTKVVMVWDKPSRLFHWVNLFLIAVLMFIGLVMLFKSELGISGLEAKIKLKQLHVIIGYLFAANLLVRLCWGFIGSRYARFSAIMPKVKEITAYKSALRQGKSPQYLGHNPIGKLAVMVIFVNLSIIMATGLIRAGTDIYYPPFGSMITASIASDGVDPASIKPYDDTGVNPDRVAAIKPYKSLAGKLHLYSVYFLMLLVVLHVSGVIYAELRHQPGIISAMVSGNKWIRAKPVDE